MPANSPLRLNTYVCSSSLGRADLGMRYIELVQAFGPRGVLANICSPEGFSSALDKLGTVLLQALLEP